MRQDKKWTIIKGPKETRELKYFNCKIHHVRLVPVGEELRCPLCGSNIPEDFKEEDIRIIGTI